MGQVEVTGLHGVDPRTRSGDPEPAHRVGQRLQLCLLVMIGARPDGTKELLAVQDGYRESKESRRDSIGEYTDTWERGCTLTRRP